MCGYNAPAVVDILGINPANELTGVTLKVIHRR